ncbi:hypothetical protein [Syntrophus gentianae]|uniref:hypothetical protein n=1 Tax=Syntrophus gentianae TaxID=43775 RepID=UPI0015875D58|nr:hypothetical protein [Syntrophus gentianae]
MVIASGMGWLSPILAAIVHNVGSVLVVVASASLSIFPGDFSTAEKKDEGIPNS